jgi:hypothetical protein
MSKLMVSSFNALKTSHQPRYFLGRMALFNALKIDPHASPQRRADMQKPK